MSNESHHTAIAPPVPININQSHISAVRELCAGDGGVASAGGPAAPEHQIALRFWPIIEGLSRNGPCPERALWRELLRVGLAGVARFEHRGRPYSATAVHHVGLMIYFLADRRGVVEDRSIQDIADEIPSMAFQTVQGCLQVIARLRLVREIKTGRRSSNRWEMNLGGVSWSTIRARAKAIRRSESSHHAITESSHHAITSKGLRTYGLDLVPAAAAVPPAVAVADRADDQQQQTGELEPTAPQLRGIASMVAELGEPDPAPATRAEADQVFRTLKLRIEEARRGGPGDRADGWTPPRRRGAGGSY